MTRLREPTDRKVGGLGVLLAARADLLASEAAVEVHEATYEIWHRGRRLVVARAIGRPASPLGETVRRKFLRV